MISFELERITRKQLLLLAITILLLLLLQFSLIKHLKTNLVETQSVLQENILLAATLEAQADSVTYYKSNVQFNNIFLPQPVASPTELYALLVNLLSNLEFSETVISKYSEEIESVSFKVTGKSDYFTLMRLFLSFRQSSYMLKITSLKMSYSAPAVVTFEVIVQSKKEKATGDKEIEK